MKSLSRRHFLGTAAALPHAQAAPATFAPTWASLSENYRTPDWFRDAKFGIWAHWSAQCVPEMGDWYARNMYLQGSWQYAHHLKAYGHPTQVGFMEMQNRWKVDAWEPKALMDLYEKAGAKYFVALANHHDNFDAYDSKYHGWNSVRVGPKRDIVGTWAVEAVLPRLCRNSLVCSDPGGAHSVSPGPPSSGGCPRASAAVVTGR